MNRLPKKQVAPPDVEDEEDLWNDLPDQVSADAEGDWAKAGDLVVSGDVSDPVKSEERRPMVQIGVRGWDSSEMLDREETRPGVPDARLSMEDLRVESKEEEQVVELVEKFGPKPVSVGWVIFAALAVLVVLVGSLIMMTVLSERGSTNNALGMKPMAIEPEVNYPMGEVIADLLSRQDEAVDLYDRFVHAKSPDELRSLVRSVSGVDALVGQVPDKMNVPPDWRVPRDARWEVHGEMDPVFGVLSGYDADERKFQAFCVLEGGKMRLDLEATLGHGTCPFAALVDGTGDASRVRLWVEPSPFYPAVYPEGEYRSFRVYTQMDDAPVWVFARRGTVPERELSALFHRSMFGGERTSKAMILLSLERGVKGAAPNQWQIADVLHKAWVVP